MSSRLRAVVLAASAVTVFGVLVTSNSGGYRYGVSDQAFYIPAIQRDISPAFFPHGAPLIEAQARLMVADEVIAAFCRATGVELEYVFFAGYVLTVVLFVAGVFLVGRSLLRSAWGLAAFGLALTLRHRIAETGVNTFEGYFHPRVLAFALGVVAIGALLHHRRVTAVVLVAAASLVHPTMAAWFAVWVGLAIATTAPERFARLAVAGAAVVAGAAAVAVLLGGPLAAGFDVMDPAWTSVFAEKDYLFPTDWDAATWLTNLLAPGVLVLGYAARRQRGLVSPAERGVFVGCVSLALLFAASLPFVHARLAIAVQLQTSRVLWPVEFLATAYLVWGLCEAGWRRVAPPRAWRAYALVALLALASAARGFYVLRVERDRALVDLDLPDTAWQQVGDWASTHTAIDALFLADPGHAWKYGVSFRVAADRDVFVESVKDTAVATYSRAIAAEVGTRLRAIDDFATLTADGAVRLADRHDLDYLVIDRPLDLPLVYENAQFRVYALDPHPPR